MTVQTVEIIRDRIMNGDNNHRMAVFALPPFIHGDGEVLEHNKFKYTREHLIDWFDVFFDDSIIGGQLVQRGHNCGGLLIGTYGKKDTAKFDADVLKYQLSL